MKSETGPSASSDGSSRASTDVRCGFSDSELQSGVEVVQLGSLEDVEAELDAIEIGLTASEERWKERVAAMLMMSGLALSGSLRKHRATGFVYEFTRLFNRNLRCPLPHVVSEMCRCLATLSVCIGRRMRKCGDALMQTLMEQIRKCRGDVRRDLCKCVHTMLRYAQLRGSVEGLVEYATLDPDANVRRQCLAFLLVVLETERLYSNRFLMRHIGGIVRAVKRGLDDKLPEVTDIARSVFLALERRYKHEANGIYTSLDSLGKRMIEQSRIEYEGASRKRMTESVLYIEEDGAGAVEGSGASDSAASLGRQRGGHGGAEREGCGSAVLPQGHRGQRPARVSSAAHSSSGSSAAVEAQVSPTSTDTGVASVVAASGTTAEAAVVQLLERLGLRRYESALVQNGFDTLACLRLVEFEDLEQMGVKRGHARLLLRELVASSAE